MKVHIRTIDPMGEHSTRVIDGANVAQVMAEHFPPKPGWVCIGQEWWGGSSYWAPDAPAAMSVDMPAAA